MKDLYLSKDNYLDFLFELQDNVGYRLSSHGYSRFGHVLLRIKDHDPNWSNFSANIDERIGTEWEIKKVVNVTVGDYQHRKYGNTKTSLEEIKLEYPNIEFVDIYIKEDTHLDDATNKVLAEIPINFRRKSWKISGNTNKKMTAKQKANQARFKAVIAEAKKLRKKNPSLKQAQAVKQAWAIMYGKKRAGKKVGETHKDTKSHNVNIRVVSGIKKKAKKVAGWTKGKTRFVEKGEKKPKKRAYRVNRSAGTFKSFVKIGNVPAYSDPETAKEIAIYADSDYQLYNSRKRPILINLGKKHKKGTYDIQKAAKLWKYYVDAAVQKYNKEFGGRGDKWYDLLSVGDRNLLALEYAQETKQEFDLGNYTI